MENFSHIIELEKSTQRNILMNIKHKKSSWLTAGEH